MRRFEKSSSPDDAVDRQMALLDELRRTERQAAVFRVASTIAHSVGTPLNVIVGRAALIRSHPADVGAIVDDALCIERKVEKLAGRLQLLLALLALPEASPLPCDINILLEDAVSLYEPVARTRGVALRLALLPDATTRVDRTTAFLVFTSLLSLAVHEVDPDTTIHLAAASSDTRATDGSRSRLMRIALVVPGCGFPDPRAIERFEGLPNADANASNRLQVLGMCSSLARGAGGRLEAGSTAQGVPELSLYWPTISSS